MLRYNFYQRYGDKIKYFSFTGNAGGLTHCLNTLPTFSNGHLQKNKENFIEASRRQRDQITAGQNFSRRAGFGARHPFGPGCPTPAHDDAIMEALIYLHFRIHHFTFLFYHKHNYLVNQGPITTTSIRRCRRLLIWRQFLTIQSSSVIIWPTQFNWIKAKIRCACCPSPLSSYAIIGIASRILSTLTLRPRFRCPMPDVPDVGMVNTIAWNFLRNWATKIGRQALGTDSASWKRRRRAQCIRLINNLSSSN